MIAIKRYIPALFVLLWSTGFIGAKYILPFAEPFVFLTIRYFLATISLLLLAKAFGESLKISWSAIKQSIVVAIFLHVIYIGGVFYAINIGVSAGITSVIVSLQPILVSILAIPLLGERLRWVQIAGLALGFSGVGLLLLPKVFQGDLSSAFSKAGIITCVLALLGTTAGYLAQKRGGNEVAFLPGTAVQFATSTVIFGILAIAYEDLTVTVSISFILALAWIVFALSIGSIFLLYYMLRHDSASAVSSLYYLVPPFTALQAYFFFGEKITGVGYLGMGLAVAGTLLVTRVKTAANSK